MVFYFQPGRAQDLPFTLTVNGSLTITSRIYLNPYSSDAQTRNENYTLDNIWGAGIDLRRTLGENRIAAGIGAEYLARHDEFRVHTNSGIDVPVEIGYRVVPVELSGYFYLPINTETFQIYLGGGAGFYFGERKYTFARIPSRVLTRETGFGIHVACGVEYAVTRRWAFRTEIKFRNVQFESTNQFPTLSYDTGVTLPYHEQPFTSRVSIDGMQCIAGIAFRF